MQLRRLRKSRTDLPIAEPSLLDATFHILDHEADVANYLNALCDLLDATRARFAHRKMERRLKLGTPFACDYQIIVDDKLFNRGVSARVVRSAAGEEPRVEVVIRWGAP